MSSDSESDDDRGDEQQLCPWGLRPSFRTLLEGGSKKLMLTNPPSMVTEYYKGKVSHSCGCTYDQATNAFFATAPGTKGCYDGTVVELDGNCSKPPFVVAKDLVQPAAIAVYEPGKSVCVVTNKGIFVFERRLDEEGTTVGYSKRRITHKGFYRGIATTAGGAVATFNYAKIWLLDGRTNGEEKVLAEVDYDCTVNNALFNSHYMRRMERSNACFMDIVNNRLVLSDLQKHVISMWDVEEPEGDEAPATITFVRAIDVAINPSGTETRGGRGPQYISSPDQVPLGKCAYASGIRLDAEGWVLCADANGKNIQIFDDKLNFMMRVQTPGPLPYISGLYLESGGHLMVCDRKNNMGGLRVYMLEAADDDDGFAGLQRRQLEKERQKTQPTRQVRPALPPPPPTPQQPVWAAQPHQRPQYQQEPQQQYNPWANYQPHRHLPTDYPPDRFY